MGPSPVMAMFQSGAGSGPSSHHDDATVSPAASQVPSRALVTRARNVLMVAAANV